MAQICQISKQNECGISVKIKSPAHLHFSSVNVHVTFVFVSFSIVRIICVMDLLNKLKEARVCFDF
jgi:hypothetical protein